MCAATLSAKPSFKASAPSSMKKYWLPSATGIFIPPRGMERLFHPSRTRSSTSAPAANYCKAIDRFSLFEPLCPLCPLWLSLRFCQSLQTRLPGPNRYNELVSQASAQNSARQIASADFPTRWGKFRIHGFRAETANDGKPAEEAVAL